MPAHRQTQHGRSTAPTLSSSASQTQHVGQSNAFLLEQMAQHPDNGLGDPSSVPTARWRAEAPEGFEHVNVDLMAGEPITQDTRFVRIEAGGEKWIDLEALGDQRDTVVGWMQAANGVFAFQEGQLMLGGGERSVSLSADTAEAQDVLDKANALDSDTTKGEVWQFLNDDSKALNAENAPTADRVGKQNKPGAWYNGYFIKDGEVRSHQSANDTSGNKAPQLTLDDFKQVIMSSLDAGQIKASLGNNQALFTEAIQARFSEENSLGVDGLTFLCDELWCYLQTGAGTDGQVDIGRLQAIVRALSPDTQTTADTNTHFDKTPFEVGDTGCELNRGDGVFGRATMLSLRHMLGELNSTLVDPPKINLEPETRTDDFDETNLILDLSGSMSDNYGEVIEYLKNHEIGETTLSGMLSWHKDLRESDHGPRTGDEVANTLRRAKLKDSLGRDPETVDAAFDGFGRGATESGIEQALKKLEEPSHAELHQDEGWMSFTLVPVRQTALKEAEGYWQVQTTEHAADRTLVAYQLEVRAAWWLPAWVRNKAAQRGAPTVLDALARRVEGPAAE